MNGEPNIIVRSTEFTPDQWQQLIEVVGVPAEVLTDIIETVHVMQQVVDEEKEQDD